MMTISEAALNKAVNQFFSNGGEVTVLPAFESKPLPPRTDQPVRICPARLKAPRGMSKAKLKELSDAVDSVINEGKAQRVMAMANMGLSLIQIANRTGISRGVIEALSKRLGFRVLRVAAATSRPSKAMMDDL